MKTTPHRHIADVRHEQLYAPRHEDPYFDAGKPPQDASCPECGVVFHKGRWLLHTISLIEDLSLRSVTARLAKLLLLQLADDQQTAIPRHRWATQAELN